MTLLYLPLICCPHSSLYSPPAHRIDPVIDKSLDLLFDNHFISLDPTHIFPLVTTWITEPKLALRWVSSVNYSTCILFLRDLNL